MNIDDRLRRAIIEAVTNGTGPWPIDKHHLVRGSFQDRFNRGDQQMVLWAIALAAENKAPIPEWATTALMDKLLEVSVAAKDWGGVFGPAKSPRDGEAPGARASKIAHRAKYMFKCFDLVTERHRNGEGIGGILFGDIAKGLHSNGSTVSDYYYAVKNWLAE